MPETPNYNFCELIPEAQRLLFTKVCQFDLAANQLAEARKFDIVALRRDLLLQGHLWILDNGINHRTIALMLAQLADENKVKRDSFYCLSPDSLWSAWCWIKGCDIALGDRVLKYRTNKSFAVLRHENFGQASSDVQGSTPEEIALYWKQIDTEAEIEADHAYLIPIRGEVA